MNETIYLCGQISAKAPESFEWRRRVREYFSNRKDFNIIDPCMDDFNKNNIDKKTGDPYKSKGIKLIVPRDRIYVTESTIAIVNLNLYDVDKPMIGTMFELAWYFDASNKAVIGMFNGNHAEDIYCSHPFVDRSVNVWINNEEEACKVIEYYFTKRRF